MYFGETNPMFDVEDETYWLVSAGDFEIWAKSQVEPDDGSGLDTSVVDTPVGGPTEVTEEGEEPYEEKAFAQIVVSGTANAIAFNQLFSSFIMPLKENDVKIEFKITAKSNKNYPITENSQQYKIVKESASQLGFDLGVEE